MDLVSLVITLLIVGFICYLLIWAAGQIPMPPPFLVAVKVLIAIFVVLFLLQYLGLSTLHLPPLRR